MKYEQVMKLYAGIELTITEIKSDNMIDYNNIIERLYDLGLHVGLKVKVLRTTSFGKVTVLQFDHTILALNIEEMSCLKF